MTQSVSEMADVVLGWLMSESKNIQQEFANMSKPDLIQYHHTVGRDIRNHFKLHSVEWTPEVVDGIDMSKQHPDAVSQAVIEAVWDKLNPEIQQNMKYFSTKRFGPISTGHRQWRDNGHCAWAHGYGRIVEMVFWSTELDDRGWCVDFGDLRDVKGWLEDEWDHKILLAFDDPLLDQFKTLQELGGCKLNVLPEGYGPGIELSCKYVYDKVDEIIQEKSDGRCGVQSVRIWEHENNSAMYGMYPTT